MALSVNFVDVSSKRQFPRLAMEWKGCDGLGIGPRLAFTGSGRTVALGHTPRNMLSYDVSPYRGRLLSLSLQHGS